MRNQELIRIEDAIISARGARMARGETNPTRAERLKELRHGLEASRRYAAYAKATVDLHNRRVAVLEALVYRGWLRGWLRSNL